MSTYIPTIAKAATAVGAAVVAGIALYNIDVNPWVLVGIAAAIQGLAVWAIPNKAS